MFLQQNLNKNFLFCQVFRKSGRSEKSEFCPDSSSVLVSVYKRFFFIFCQCAIDAYKVTDTGIDLADFMCLSAAAQLVHKEQIQMEELSLFLFLSCRAV